MLTAGVNSSPRCLSNRPREGKRLLWERIPPSGSTPHSEPDNTNSQRADTDEERNLAHPRRDLASVQSLSLLCFARTSLPRDPPSPIAARLYPSPRSPPLPSGQFLPPCPTHCRRQSPIPRTRINHKGPSHSLPCSTPAQCLLSAARAEPRCPT